VALVVATREPGGEFRGLPELAVGGLGDADARELLASVIRRPLDERVQERFIAEAGGNPLALLELSQGLAPAELTGALGATAAPGLLRRLEDSFRQRLGGLPETTQRLLLVAAAEPTGDTVLVWRAAGRLGIGMEAAAPAEAEGLLAIGARVTFRHPLVRSAAYRAASPEERRAAHQALADATDPRADPDRRAWHRAQAAAGPDEEVATELEHSAGRAQARGGFAAAAAFLERSTTLTPGPARRADRALAAAQATSQAGAFDAALGLLAAAEVGPLDELQRAQAALLHGQIAFASFRGRDAETLLLTAARLFEPLDARLARETYLDALSAALFAGRRPPDGGLREAGETARAAPPSPRPARAPDLLLDGLASLATDGYPAGARVLKQAVSAFRSDEVSREEGLRWLWQASYAAELVWDYGSWDVLSARHVKLASEAGALIAMPIVLNMRALPQLLAGEFAAAASLITQLESVTEATGSSVAPYASLVLAALRGRETEAARLIEAAQKEAERRAVGFWLTFAQWATAVLDNSLGRYEQALAAAEQASQDSSVLPPANWALVELIEAATRGGAPERVAPALQRLSQMTRASGTDWALGIEARARALVSGDDEAADSRYRQAIDYLGRTPLRVELGRAQLVYGEWLRRQRRIREAREQLRRAYLLFTGVGMEAFAERARAELRATGAQALKRTTGTPDLLTAQETLIARLASQGASNPQIAAQLFISPATVAYHLAKVFAKLGINSRSQLARALPTRPDEARAVISQG
ncbi:MAG TPA: LuxR C-terminal-related transcriptional regulator, partial [Streptosporangiaceae bacterium]|nr:LuxR C-terminal-related transcriptional regulator [Streptosporangiaceae bacterium]